MLQEGVSRHAAPESMSSTDGMEGHAAVGNGWGTVSTVRIWPWMARERVVYAVEVLRMRKREPHGPV